MTISSESLASFSDDLRDFFSNPVLWTAISPLETSSWVDIESFGYLQPNVRKAAWSLVNALQAKHKGIFVFISPDFNLTPVNQITLAHLFPCSVVRSYAPPGSSLTYWFRDQCGSLFLSSSSVRCLVALETFLLIDAPTEFPESWNLVNTRSVKTEEGSDSEESEQEEAAVPTTAPQEIGKCEAYDEFLRFLESGCSGSPQQGYPTVVLIVSTIPSSVSQHSVYNVFHADADLIFLDSCFRVCGI